MGKQPSVSVVIPCLNRAHLIRPTIESILGQDYPKIECIVMDGGSTDGTPEILKSYGDRITWVSEPDKGQSDAINKGWQMSKGEIVTWLNADDLWEVPSAVSQAVEFLVNHPEVDVVYGDCGIVDADGKQVGMASSREWDLEYAVEFSDHVISQPASFIRRNILYRVGFLDLDLHYQMDKELWWRIGLQGKIDYMPVLLAYQRNTPGKGFDGDKLAPTCPRITEKFYSIRDVPLKLQRIKRRAFSNSYIKGASYAYGSGRHWRTAVKYAARAVVEDPSNSGNVIYRLLRAGLFFVLGRSRFLNSRDT